MKKIISAFLAAMLLVTMLSACSGADTTTPSETADVTVEASASPETLEPSEDEPTAPAETPTTDVSTAPAPDSEDLSVFPLETTETISVWTAFQSPLTGIVNGYDDWPVFKRIEELTNVRVEWTEVAQSTSRETFNLMIVSGDYCDMGRSVGGMYTGGSAAAYDDGVFMDITEYVLDYMPNYNSVIDNSIWGREYIDQKLLSEDGRYLFLSTIPTAAYAMSGTTVRGDWLEECGLDIPSTIDELENVMEAFKNTYGLDNVLLVNNENYHSLFASSLNFAGLPSMGATGSYYVVDDTIINGVLTGAYREQLARMNKWYNAGYFDDGFVTRTGNPKDPVTIEMLAKGECGVFETSVTIWSTLQDAATDDNFTLSPVPVFTEPSDGEQHFYDLGRVVSESISFFEGNKHPELCAQWIDFMFTDYAADLMAYGIEGESFNYDAGGKPAWDFNLLEKAVENTTFSISTYAEFYYGIKGNFINLSRADALFAFYDESQLDAIDVFSDQSNWGDHWVFDVKLTTEESQAIAKVNADISTFIEEQSMQFILGVLDINSDSAWDNFTSGIKNLNEQEIYNIYAGAYERTK